MTIEIDGGDIRRVCFNASLFVGTGGALYPVARLDFQPSRLVVTATDRYTLMRDEMALPGPVDPRTVYVDKKGLAELAGKVTDRRGHSLGLTVKPGDGVVLEGSEGNAWAAPDLTGAWATDEATWAAADEVLRRVEREPFTNQPEPFMVNPDYFARLARVEATKLSYQFNGRTEQGRVLDLWCASPESPILVKIGATFVAAIATVDREQERFTPAVRW